MSHANLWITCCVSCDSWPGGQQPEQPSVRALQPARWHKPPWPAAGHSPLDSPDWLPAHPASVRTHTHTQTHNEDENKNYETMFMLVWLVYVSVYLEAGLLRGQVGTSSYCAQLYRGHCAADVQVLPCWSWCLHQGYAVTATHWLGWILGNKHTQP